MVENHTKYRVRYADTDQMGYVYYGNYPRLYEIGRVELIRSLGITYHHLEQELGIKMPVLQLECRYKRPALYDELITIETVIRERPTKMIVFDHRIINHKGEELNTGKVKLFFVHWASQKRVSVPQYLEEKLVPYFE